MILRGGKCISECFVQGEHTCKLRGLTRDRHCKNATCFMQVLSWCNPKNFFGIPEVKTSRECCPVRGSRE
jgi:hypothetical protein